MSHVALDNRREDPEPVIIVPYFPRGLAKSTEQPLDFNFTLYLYDTLRLPFPRRSRSRGAVRRLAAMHAVLLALCKTEAGLDA